MTQIIGWLLLGLVAVLPLLWAAHRRPFRQSMTLLAIALIIAALVYPVWVFWQQNIVWLQTELIGLSFFALFAAAGLLFSPWFLVFGWLLHPVWDLAVHALGPGVEVIPAWYAWICVSFDGAVALAIVCRIVSAARSQNLLGPRAIGMPPKAD